MDSHPSGWLPSIVPGPEVKASSEESLSCRVGFMLWLLVIKSLRYLKTRLKTGQEALMQWEFGRQLSEPCPALSRKSGCVLQETLCVPHSAARQCLRTEEPPAGGPLGCGLPGTPGEAHLGGKQSRALSGPRLAGWPVEIPPPEAGRSLFLPSTPPSLILTRRFVKWCFSSQRRGEKVGGARAAVLGWSPGSLCSGPRGGGRGVCQAALAQ